ncbi:Gfo/Idh/MocA family oxidoreductase [Antarcticibacterium sp. 1MA-6-2]|uniref:Gfo/Idh/MocA family oxidoreductase n=1 Tax=Antarcticibacterium sp. 1MA-6-2 TaxID=2908210 RepID=UPI001F24D3C9|nr:Gfo/Idh/MocA family oxidoreductase [Antarcticibacterium sp. 1MA-6-2]UJH90152.1 Gfo/Idh/MocA family oxidoreductase [Antarcticibacterium sp. 1MA-6-2]
MKTVNVALVGFGSGARFFNAPIISSIEGFDIKKILTSTPDNVKNAETDFPKAIILTDYKEILEDSSIGLVVIATPNHTHTDYAARALKAGKHVIVEKPLATSSQDAEYLIDLSKSHNKLLTVNHNRRWASDFLTVKKLLEQKRLGRLVEYEAHLDRFRKEIKTGWKQEKENAGNGLLYDLGSHLIDQALLLFGHPLEVFASLQIQRDEAQVVDNFELILFYSGLKVTLKAGMLVREKGPVFTLYGTDGTFLKSGYDVQEEALKRGEKPQNVLQWGEEPKDSWGKLTTVAGTEMIKSERGNYKKVYQNLYDAILGKEDLEITGEQAKAVVKVIELAMKSHAEKRIIPFAD